MATPATAQAPSRYDDILDQRLAQARNVIQQAQAAGKKHSRWPQALVGVGGLVVGVLGTFLGLLARAQAPSTSRVPFEPGTLVSSDSLGIAFRPADVVPLPRPTPTPLPTPTPRPEPTHSPVRSTWRPRPVVPFPPRTGNTPTAEPDMVELPLDSIAATILALEDHGEAALPPGTRLSALLTSPIVTGAVGAPVSAVLATDVVLEGRVLVPAGAALVGEAFATRSDDRVQVVVHSLVSEGTTVPLRALALGPDGHVGLSGKVERKASKTRKGLGRVLGAVASTLTFGAIGGGGAEQILTDGLLNAGAASLGDIERAWLAERSDKVIRVQAGTPLVVWLQTEAKLP